MGGWRKLFDLEEPNKIHIETHYLCKSRGRCQRIPNILHGNGLKNHLRQWNNYYSWLVLFYLEECEKNLPIILKYQIHRNRGFVLYGNRNVIIRHPIPPPPKPEILVCKKQKKTDVTAETTWCDGPCAATML